MTNNLKKQIKTNHAPKPVGPYSQAIQEGKMIYLSGQIGLHPTTSKLVSDDVNEQIKQVFNNIKAVCESVGGQLDSIVKLTIYVTDLKCVPMLNETITTMFTEPYAARTTIQVSALPMGAKVEVEAIMAVK